jgi:hypothetical protein
MRTIIQIAIHVPYTVCVCDDGSAWWFDADNDSKWRKYPDIPQPEQKECEHGFIKEGVCVDCGNMIHFDKNMNPIAVKPIEPFDINKTKTGRTVSVEPSRQDLEKVADWIQRTEETPLNAIYRKTAETFAQKLLEIVPDLAERIK